MTIHPQAQALIDMMASAGFDGIEHQPIENVRLLVSTIAGMGGHPSDVNEVRATTIPAPSGGIPVRLYRPASDIPLPVFVWLHAGGWVYGSVDLNDQFCRMVANGVGAVVLNVDYRLAPEHSYPAALDDVMDSISWVRDHGAEIGGDAERVAMGGESAGGNLAAAAALRLRDSGAKQLTHQVIVCAALDSAMIGASYSEHGEGKFLTKSLLEWAWNQYASGHLNEPYVAPLKAPDFNGLPPALVITAECDPAHDDGVAYHRRLLDAGVASEWIDYEGMIHGFFLMATLFPQAHEATQAVINALAKAFA
jgi:acetyl esterase